MLTLCLSCSSRICLFLHVKWSHPFWVGRGCTIWGVLTIKLWSFRVKLYHPLALGSLWGWHQTKEMLWNWALVSKPSDSAFKMLSTTPGVTINQSINNAVQITWFWDWNLQKILKIWCNMWKNNSKPLFQTLPSICTWSTGGLRFDPDITGSWEHPADLKEHLVLGQCPLGNNFSSSPNSSLAFTHSPSH